MKNVEFPKFTEPLLQPQLQRDRRGLSLHPNLRIAGAARDPDGGFGSWDALPHREQWDQCAVKLCADYQQFELNPELWGTYTFGNGVNGFQYRAFLDSISL